MPITDVVIIIPAPLAGAYILEPHALQIFHSYSLLITKPPTFFLQYSHGWWQLRTDQATAAGRKHPDKGPWHLVCNSDRAHDKKRWFKGTAKWAGARGRTCVIPVLWRWLEEGGGCSGTLLCHSDSWNTRKTLAGKVASPTEEMAQSGRARPAVPCRAVLCRWRRRGGAALTGGRCPSRTVPVAAGRGGAEERRRGGRAGEWCGWTGNVSSSPAGAHVAPPSEEGAAVAARYPRRGSRCLAVSLRPPQVGGWSEPLAGWPGQPSPLWQRGRGGKVVPDGVPWGQDEPSSQSGAEGLVPGLGLAAEPRAASERGPAPVMSSFLLLLPIRRCISEYLYLSTSVWQKRREEGLCHLSEHSKDLCGTLSPSCSSVLCQVVGRGATALKINKTTVFCSWM